MSCPQRFKHRLGVRTCLVIAGKAIFLPSFPDFPNFKEKKVRRFLKGIRYVLFVLVLAIGVYMLTAVVLSLSKTRPETLSSEPKVDLFIGSNGVHLDIIVEVKQLDRAFAQQLQIPAGTKYVAFGWGEKNFYLNTPQWKDLTFPTAFKAVFLKSESAMHVTAYKQARVHWKKTKICPQQMEMLLYYIVQSFQYDPDKKIIPIGISGYGYNDRFYAARGSFSLFKTCNVWVNTGLKKAGIPTSIWSPFAFGVIYHFGEE